LVNQNLYCDSANSNQLNLEHTIEVKVEDLTKFNSYDWLFLKENKPMFKIRTL